MVTRVTITEDHFVSLLNGEVVLCDGIELLLADIGVDRITHYLDRLIESLNHGVMAVEDVPLIASVEELLQNAQAEPDLRLVGTCDYCGREGQGSTCWDCEQQQLDERTLR